MIRTATKNDFAAICALLNELRPHDATIFEEGRYDDWCNLLSQTHVHTFVYELSTQLVSCATLVVASSLPYSAQHFGGIEHVVTLHKFQRLGYGQATLQYALEAAWQLNCYKVTLLSGNTLKPAHAMYQKLGFDGNAERGFIIKRPINSI